VVVPRLADAPDATYAQTDLRYVPIGPKTEPVTIAALLAGKLFIEAPVEYKTIYLSSSLEAFPTGVVIDINFHPLYKYKFLNGGEFHSAEFKKSLNLFN
jgi:hypothetical protein